MKLRVKAAPGIRFPKEGAPRRYITEAATELVVATPYYRTAIAQGDLVEVKEPA